MYRLIQHLGMTYHLHKCIYIVQALVNQLTVTVAQNSRKKSVKIGSKTPGEKWIMPIKHEKSIVS